MELTAYSRSFASLYIDLSEKTSVESTEISEGIVLDYDDVGKLAGIDIDNASSKVKLEELIIDRLPSESKKLWHNIRHTAQQRLIPLNQIKSQKGICTQMKKLKSFDVTSEPGISGHGYFIAWLESVLGRMSYKQKPCPKMHLKLSMVSFEF